MIPVTVVILTFNEKDNICSLAETLHNFFDDVHVVDSGSTDGTDVLAKEKGLRVFRNPFTGFGDQRNWAIDNVPHKYPWTLHLDADERLTEDFLTELNSVVSSNPKEAGFYVPNRLILEGIWLRYSSGYPVYQVRLFHRDRLRFENCGHGQKEITDGNLGYFSKPYLHLAFSKGIQSWLEKHARYATQEAEMIAGTGFNKDIGKSVVDCLQADPVKRRRAFKNLSFYLPGRPLQRLIYTLFLKRGILDGRAGITYAKMLAAYESMLVAALANNKLKTKQNRPK